MKIFLVASPYPPEYVYNALNYKTTQNSIRRPLKAVKKKKNPLVGYRRLWKEHVNTQNVTLPDSLKEDW